MPQGWEIEWKYVSTALPLVVRNQKLHHFLSFVRKLGTHEFVASFSSGPFRVPALVFRWSTCFSNFDKFRSAHYKPHKNSSPHHSKNS